VYVGADGTISDDDPNGVGPCCIADTRIRDAYSID
jgi:hypothetical protein